MNKCKKILSCVLSIVFFTDTIAWAGTVNSQQSMGHGPLIERNIFVPEQYGKIEHFSPLSKESPKQPLVVLVKDAHCNYEAQKNISKIVDILVKDYKIDLIGMEGASSKVDPSVLGDSPDADKRHEVADKYLKKGWLCAAEGLALEKGKDYGFSIWGVEDNKLYLQNLKAFRDVYTLSQPAERFIEIGNDIAEGLRNKLYERELLDFDTKIKEYRANKFPLTELIFLLYQKNQETFIACSNLKLVLKAIQLEKSIDFDKVETERSLLVKEIEKISTKEEVEQLVKNSLLFKLGRISALDYYSYLERMIIVRKVTVSFYNLRKYTRIIKLNSKINEGELFKEIDKIVDNVYQNSISDPIAKKLHTIDEFLYRLNKLIKLEITRDELSTQNHSVLKIPDIVEFLKIQAGINNVPIKPELNNEGFVLKVSDFCKNPEEFYKYALERDTVLVDNLLEKMQKENKDRAVLIAGGFHAEGAKQKLKEKGVDVITITPSITREDTEAKKIYLSRMIDERINPDNLLKGTGIANLAEPRITGWWQEYGIEISEINEQLRRVFEEESSLYSAAGRLAAGDIQLSESDISIVLSIMEQLPNGHSAYGLLASLVPAILTSSGNEQGEGAEEEGIKTPSATGWVDITEASLGKTAPKRPIAIIGDNDTERELHEIAFNNSDKKKITIRGKPCEYNFRISVDEAISKDPRYLGMVRNQMVDLINRHIVFHNSSLGNIEGIHEVLQSIFLWTVERLSNIEIILVNDPGYLVKVEGSKVLMDSRLLEHTRCFQSAVLYGLSTILNGAADEGSYSKLLKNIQVEFDFNGSYSDYVSRIGELATILQDKIEQEEKLNNLETVINEKIASIRSKEKKGEDVDADYQKVREMILELQLMYRNYEEFMSRHNLVDKRKDFMIMVPTFNRPDKLMRLLQSLETEVDAFQYCKNRKVRVVIVDDSDNMEFQQANELLVKRLTRKFTVKYKGNLSLVYYSPQKQRNIVMQLKDSDCDLRYFVNKQSFSDDFSKKGYSGIRNMMRIVSAIEIAKMGQTDPSISKKLLIMHVDDDMEFSNPLAMKRKDGVSVSEDENLRVHIYNIFSRISTAFRENPWITLLGGSCTFHDGSLATLMEEGYMNYAERYSPSPRTAKRGDILGGIHVCDSSFELDAIPIPPGNFRSEDIFWGRLTNGQRLNRVTISHHQSLQRDIVNAIVNEFEGGLYVNLLSKHLKPDNSVQSNTGWQKFADVVSQLQKEDIADLEAFHASYGELIRKVLLYLYNFGQRSQQFDLSGFEIKNAKDRLAVELKGYYMERTVQTILGLLNDISSGDLNETDIRKEVSKRLNLYLSGSDGEKKTKYELSELKERMQQTTVSGDEIMQYISGEIAKYDDPLEQLQFLKALLNEMLRTKLDIGIQKENAILLFLLKNISNIMIERCLDLYSGVKIKGRQDLVDNIDNVVLDNEKTLEEIIGSIETLCEGHDNELDKLSVLRAAVGEIYDNKSISEDRKSILITVLFKKIKKRKEQLFIAEMYEKYKAMTKNMVAMMGNLDQWKKWTEISRKPGILLNLGQEPQLAIIGKEKMMEKPSWQKFWGPLIEEIIFRGMPFVFAQAFKILPLVLPISPVYTALLIIGSNVIFSIFSAIIFSVAHQKDRRNIANRVSLINSLVSTAITTIAVLFNFIDTYWVFWLMLAVTTAVHSAINISQLKKHDERIAIIQSGTEASGREKKLNEEDLVRVASLLGIKTEDLRKIMEEGGSSEVTLEYRNRLLSVLKADGKITDDELQIIVESADKVAGILGLINDALPVEVRQRISGIQNILAMDLSVKKLAQKTEKPQFIINLITQLQEFGKRKGIDPEMADGIVDELYNMDGYTVEDGKLRQSSYYAVMIETIKDMLEITEETDIFNLLDKYQRAKAIAKNGLKVNNVGDISPDVKVDTIITDYLRGRSQPGDVAEKLASIIALYMVDNEIVLKWFNDNKKKEIVKKGLENILQRSEFSEVKSEDMIPSAIIDNFAKMRDMIGNIARETEGSRGLYYLDSYGNGGTAVFDSSNVIDRLETGGKLDIDGFAQFLKDIGKEYLLLGQGGNKQLLAFLYQCKQIESLLSAKLPQITEFNWTENTPLVVSARLLVGDVSSNKDTDGSFNGTYSIEPIGEGAVWLLRKAKKDLQILYTSEDEKKATEMWLLGHGIKGVKFITKEEYPYDVKGAVAMLAQGALTEKPVDHKIIETDPDLKNYDSILMSRMAIILGQESGIKENMTELFLVYYNVNSIKDLPENIRESVEAVLETVEKGGSISLILPPITPFIKVFYNTLKNAREIVASAA